MCSFLPNVFNGFISLLWYITCTLTMKNIKVNFFLLYLFWIDPLFKCRPVFFCQENSFKESYFIYFFIYKKHAYKSVIFFFIYIFFIITFVLEEKYSTGQIEIESYVVGSLLTTYLGHSNLHLRVIGKLFKWRSYLHFKLIFFQYQFKCF